MDDIARLRTDYMKGALDDEHADPDPIRQFTRWWDEVTKFVIDPPFYQVDVIALVNQNAWTKLPKDAQDVLAASMQEVEKEAYEHFRKLITQDREKIKKKGVLEVDLPAEEAAKYLQLAYDASWKEVLW